MGGAGSDDCDKENVEMITAVNGMELTPHSDDGPWEPHGYKSESGQIKKGHWLVSNIVADHDTGAMINVGGGGGGWQLLELRQGKPGWISEESADRAADAPPRQVRCLRRARAWPAEPTRAFLKREEGVA